MPAATRLDEARRWTKFPATLLFITGLLWLLAVIFRAASDWNDIAQRSETLLGALMVVVLGVVVPLGSPLAGVFILYLQRKALYIGAVLPLLPLVYLTWDKFQRIGAKFHEYRSAGSVSSFGAAVFDAVILLGLWAIAWVHVLYCRRALRELADAEQWASAPVTANPTSPASRAASGANAAAAAAIAYADSADLPDDDEVCFLLPDTVEDERD